MNAKLTLFSMMLVLTLVVAGFALASNRSAAIEERPEIQRSVLPREWVWQKKAVTFDDIYRR